jgi:hypothetical protein
MPRLVVVVAMLVIAGNSAAQCWPAYPPYPPPIYVPVYPLTPAVWGAPAPRPLPPAPVPFVPRGGAGVREEDEGPPPKPADPAKNGTRPREPDGKEKDVPRLPKIKLPLPGDPTDIKPPAPPKELRKDDPPAKKAPANGGKPVEQFFIPAEGNRAEPKAEVKVGFFNHSDREITLDVNGESVRLPSEQYVTLRLPRTFQWSERGQKATDVAVPPDADGIEIVFRR